MSKKLILLHGLARSGKDTLAKELKLINPLVRSISFAAPVKQIIADSFGFDVEDFNFYKNNGHVMLHGVPTDAKTISGESFQMQSYREFIQRFGSNKMKELFGINVWVGLATKQIDYWFNYTDTVVITDLRFMHELEAIQNYYNYGFLDESVEVYTIKITRDSAGLLAEGNHESEVDLKEYKEWDFIVDNNGTLEDLHLEADAIIKEINWNSNNIDVKQLLNILD